VPLSSVNERRKRIKAAADASVDDVVLVTVFMSMLFAPKSVGNISS